MSTFFDGCRQGFAVISRSISAAGRFGNAASRRGLRWLAVPVHFFLAAFGFFFLFSLVAWGLADRYAGTLLFFPDSRKGIFRTEVRPLPRRWSAEARAELVASEVLLGPRDPGLVPVFPQGVSLVTVIYRKGSLFLDLSESAALEGKQGLDTGLTALERSVKAALPGLRRIAITIGGREPYADGLEKPVGNDVKSEKKN
jgi:hypothetical protein